MLFFSCFFFSRHFHENFKFLKNCAYDFHEILHSHSTPKGAPACAKTSKSYGWDVRNIAKISPKMAKKQPFFDFFRFSQKLSIRFERNFLQLFHTILESYMCNGIKIVWLGCEKHSQKLAQKWSKKGHFSTSEGKRPQPTPLPHMRLWFSFGKCRIVPKNVKGGPFGPY